MLAQFIMIGKNGVAMDASERERERVAPLKRMT
jgi:hypothetical protein